MARTDVLGFDGSRWKNPLRGLFGNGQEKSLPVPDQDDSEELDDLPVAEVSNSSDERNFDISDPQVDANLSILFPDSKRIIKPASYEQGLQRGPFLVLLKRYLSLGSDGFSDETAQELNFVKVSLEEAMSHVVVLLASSSTRIEPSPLTQTLQQFSAELQSGVLLRETIITLLHMPELQSFLESRGKEANPEKELKNIVKTRLSEIMKSPKLSEYLKKKASVSGEPVKSILERLLTQLTVDLLDIREIFPETKEILYISGINLSQEGWQDNYAIVEALFLQSTELNMKVVDERATQYLEAEFPKQKPTVALAFSEEPGRLRRILWDPSPVERSGNVEFPQYDENLAPVGDGSDHGEKQNNVDERQALTQYVDWFLLTHATLYGEYIEGKSNGKLKATPEKIQEYIAQTARTLLLQANTVLRLSDEIAKLKVTRDISTLSAKDLEVRKKRVARLEDEWLTAVQQFNAQINPTSDDQVRVLPEGFILLDNVQVQDRVKVKSFITRMKRYLEGAVLNALPERRQHFRTQQIESLVPARQVGFLRKSEVREIPAGFEEALDAFNTQLESGLVRPIVLSGEQKVSLEDAAKRSEILGEWLHKRIQLEMLLGVNYGVDGLLQDQVEFPDGDVIDHGLRQLLDVKALIDRRKSSDELLDWQFTVKMKMFGEKNGRLVPQNMKQAFSQVLDLLYSKHESVNMSFLTDLVIQKRDGAEQNKQGEYPETRLTALLLCINLMKNHVEGELVRIDSPTNQNDRLKKQRLRQEVVDEVVTEVKQALWVLEFIKIRLEQANELLRDIRRNEEVLINEGIVTLPSNGKKEPAFRVLDTAASQLIDTFDTQIDTLSAVRTQNEGDVALFDRLYQSYFETHIRPQLENIQKVFDLMNAPVSSPSTVDEGN